VALATARDEEARDERHEAQRAFAGHRVNLTRMGGDRAAILFPLLSLAASKRV
jgi:hypothetical protein